MCFDVLCYGWTPIRVPCETKLGRWMYRYRWWINVNHFYVPLIPSYIETSNLNICDCLTLDDVLKMWKSSICLTFIGIPKMHKNPYKHRFIAGSSKRSTKPLSILLTKLLTHINQGLQKYCETAYSRSGVNQMWILKNSKELLGHFKSPNFNLITNIKSLIFRPFTQPLLIRNLKAG